MTSSIGWTNSSSPNTITREEKSRCTHLYGIARDDVDYIMDTFPIVKRKDEAAHGEYRTKRAIPEIYDAMQQAIETRQPYQTLLDPPPADPRVAHPPKDESDVPARMEG